MTDEEKMIREQLSELTGYDASDIAAGLQPFQANLADISTFKAAERATEKVQVDSDEHDALLMRWVEVSWTFDMLDELRPKVLRKPAILMHLNAQCVRACKTAEDVYRASREIKPDTALWPALVHKGLQIMREENQKAKA